MGMVLKQCLCLVPLLQVMVVHQQHCFISKLCILHQRHNLKNRFSSWPVIASNGVAEDTFKGIMVCTDLDSTRLKILVKEKKGGPHYGKTVVMHDVIVLFRLQSVLDAYACCFFARSG